MHDDQRFELLLQTYLKQVESGVNYDECFILLGKMQMLHELFPSDLFQETINKLPIPIHVHFVDSIFYHPKKDHLVFYLDFRHNMDEFQMWFHFDELSSVWIFGEISYNYGDEQEVLNEEETKKILLDFNIHHPAISAILVSEKQKVKQLFDRSQLPFSQIFVSEKRVFFQFEGYDKSYCYDIKKNRMTSSGLSLYHPETIKKQHFHNDGIASFMTLRTNLVDRIMHHPNVRLRLLF